jgi:hypothetical protein
MLLEMDGLSQKGQDRIGLCADCKFMRVVKSDRGSTFLFCERSITDKTFPKYPRLPVLQCRGYEQISGKEVQ